MGRRMYITMKDIVTKYRDVIEDCELLLGDNNNLKNMSYNDIDEICNYVIVEVYKIGRVNNYSIGEYLYQSYDCRS